MKEKKIESTGIQLKNPSVILKQSSFTGKVNIICGEIFDYPHIIIEKNNEILVFAQQFVK